MIFKKIHTLLVLPALALVAASCSKQEPVVPVCDSPERVLLVYIGTDNNLAGLEQEKLDALRQGWSGVSTDHIIAFVDRAGEESCLVELSNLVSGEGPREIAIYDNENSASAEVFGRVVCDVSAMFPHAENFGLLLFSHASGWLPAMSYYDPQRYTPNDTRSIVLDGTEAMELSDFAAAIPDGTFDYIVFEACFMAGIEVAYELRHKTDRLLASSAEIVDPGFAPIYPVATGELLGGDLPGFGRRVFDHTLTYVATDPRRSATYSVIDTAALEALAMFVREHCDLSREVEVADIQRFDRNDYALFFDFEDYHARLLDTDEERAELSRLMDACIEWKAATTTFMSGYNGFSIDRHSGLTTYIPQSDFPALNAAYRSLDWVRATTAAR